jgi:hypothetical protein
MDLINNIMKYAVALVIGGVLVVKGCEYSNQAKSRPRAS